MCGIFTIVPSPIDPSRLAKGALALDTNDPEQLKQALSTLDFYRVHQAYTQADTLERLRAAVTELDAETAPEGADDDPAVSAAVRLRGDVIWRIEHDLLDLLDAMSALLEDPERGEHGASVWLAWQVELTLRSLGRLEVRGRDSAGLSVMLWYDDGDDIARHLAGAEPHPQISRDAVAEHGCLVLTYRVAEEVGALGFNESTLRGLLQTDPAFQAAIRATPSQSQVLAHTRWASNGIISLGNAHPIDGTLEAEGDASAHPPGRTLAVLNGDVDNYLELTPSLAGTIPEGVTTDAKLIPGLVETYLGNGHGRHDEAVNAMMEKIEGSVATVLVRADCPGTLWCGMKGTGQSLYLAQAGDALILASEVYGTAEITDGYWPVEKAQERRADGQDSVVLRLDTSASPRVTRLSGGSPEVLEPDYRTAEITTRDVDRRGFTHFFRKELEEAVLSVQKTILGRYRRTPAVGDAEPEVDFLPLYTVTGDGHRIFGAVRDGGIRRFVFVGQGSAHVAGEVGACYLTEVVGPLGMTATAMTAGDFSAHELRSDLSDTCLVAISQSGTTTDTNRCLALARERGARVMGIVNRRNSTMVELCDAVVYTSDGRDIEMAVASTKAFYSQVVATFMLTQHVGLLIGALVPSQVAAALIELERLPDVMQQAFDIEDQVAECARAVSLKRRHWSVLGSGVSLATAQEVRIKFSELCYKSVSVDILENKKHIDLSAEPLILAVLHDLRGDLVADAIKEVSIFAAHRGITVAICDRDGDLYRAYTPYVLEVPQIGYGLGVVTTAILGHLFAYHTAAAMDEVAQRLRRLRKALLQDGTAGHPFELAPEARELYADLLRGDIDALWPAGSAARLSATLQGLATAGGSPTAQATLSSFVLAAESGDGADVSDFGEWCRNQLSTAIADSTRSIDSIRHQAKTITVGTSRLGYSRTSVMGSALAELGVGIEDLPPTLNSALTAVDEMLAEIPSGIVYKVTRESVAPGVPAEIYLRTERKMGLACEVESRFDRGAPIAGTKLTAVRRRQAMVVQGVRDGAQLLVFPILRGGMPSEVVLLHLKLGDEVTEQQKLRFLEAFPQRTEHLMDHFGELLGRRIEPRDLARIETEPLLFSPLTILQEKAIPLAANV